MVEDNARENNDGYLMFGTLPNPGKFEQLQTISPKLRVLGDVTLKILGIPLNVSPKPLKLETSNLVYSFIWANSRGWTNNFLERGRGLNHMTHKILGIPTNVFPFSNSIKATDFKFGTQLHVDKLHKAGKQFFRKGA